MHSVPLLSKYSVGVGDRFAHQAKAQLQACMKAAEYGVEVIPVWNKSNREHTIIGSSPASTRAAADEAVKTLSWSKPYYVDADHINLKTVDKFIEASDFFTIDVADLIGRPSRSCRRESVCKPASENCWESCAFRVSIILFARTMTPSSRSLTTTLRPSRKRA